mmetsp:Transcript_110807/g.308674  ORF Transcript_110807/g.308674 Transcript_110807/m.308674 type:complete len:283 (+) Transcript_110807:12-860(+)
MALRVQGQWSDLSRSQRGRHCPTKRNKLPQARSNNSASLLLEAQRAEDLLWRPACGPDGAVVLRGEGQPDVPIRREAILSLLPTWLRCQCLHCAESRPRRGRLARVRLCSGIIPIGCQYVDMELVQVCCRLEGQVIAPSAVLRHHVKVAPEALRLRWVLRRVEDGEVGARRAAEEPHDLGADLRVLSGGSKQVPGQGVELAVAITLDALAASVRGTELHGQGPHVLPQTILLRIDLGGQWQVILAPRHVSQELLETDVTADVHVHLVKEVPDVILLHAQEVW